MVTGKFTVFKLGDEELAIDSLKISSAKEYSGKKQKISGVPKFILGKDETGKLLLDVDLYLDFPLKKLKYILYTKIRGNEVGFVVNEKLDEITIDLANISPTPDSILAKYKTHFITGIAKVDDRLIIIIDPEQVFSNEDVEKIATAQMKKSGGNPLQGVLSVFSKKKEDKKTPITQQTTTQSMQQDISVSNSQPSQQTQSNQQQQVQPGSPQIPSNVEIVNAQSAQQIVDANVSQVLSDVTGGQASNVHDIEVVDNIKDGKSQEILAAQRISQLKSEVNAPVIHQEEREKEKVDQFLEKLKEDPFLKHQEEVQENLKKIRESIAEMDGFFEELIVNEQENGGNFDASEEVLLSSIGIELKKDPKYLSDLLACEKREQRQPSTKKAEKSKSQVSTVKKISPEELKKREGERKKNCPNDQSFGFWDGRKIFNVEQLEEELKVMQDNEFYNHVTDQKNDFAIWVRYALNLTTIADILQGMKTKQDSITALDNYFAGITP